VGVLLDFGFLGKLGQVLLDLDAPLVLINQSLFL
jgi:hypothetical protein